MKKQIIYTAFLIGNLFTISCQEKKDVFNHSEIKANESRNHMDIDINEIKQQIKLQERIESDEKEFNNPYEMTQKDFLIENQLIYNGLKQNGYRDISDEKFYEKLKLIFNIDFNNKCNRINKGNEFIVYYGNMMDGNIETLKYNQFDLYSVTNNMFFSLDRHIYLYIITLKNIIQINPDNTFKIKVPQEIITRNKYLFNDDKSQFAWLINNDEDFMQSLVTTFGYTEDKKLLKWAFEKQGFKYQKYPPDEILKNYGNFLWTKQCNGEIKLHPNTLNLIKELVKPSSKYGNEEYILYLAEYINYLVNNEKETELNLQQKAKIAAYLLAFGEQYKYNKEYGYNQMFLGKFIFYQDPDKKYKKEFEKNNYYNLPNLKKWYQQAEQEKDMFENDQTLADDPQPMDYLYRATYMKGPYSK
ncbi:hypothetical protein [Apibacter adventoris]|uniref:hypothetical protein n=1 Tax=Apibacter adventoris TaxID=1679466 RepID=UPI000CF6D807|nr:hypothetical protein [Apibacter adventoris]PQL95927.1 hypothetical protein C4S76_00045 [Apibacter adventoris]